MRRTDAKDTKKRYFRAGDRIVNENGAWYFSSREGDVGPFQSRMLAQHEVQRFLLERQQLGKFERGRAVLKHASQQLSRQASELPSKPASARKPLALQTLTSSQQTRHHLDRQVESSDLLLTLDDDLLI